MRWSAVSRVGASARSSLEPGAVAAITPPTAAVPSATTATASAARNLCLAIRGAPLVGPRIATYPACDDRNVHASRRGTACTRPLAIIHHAIDVTLGDDRHRLELRIRRLTAVGDAELDGLTDVLLDCVRGGASIGFMDGLTREHARAFWRRVAAAVAAGERALLVAEDEFGVCGTVQLAWAQPDNQPHRADVSKMLVHRRARRRGLGAALMRAAEGVARDAGRTLLVLDTGTGTDAERLYTRLGWQRVGEVPGYALWPDGRPCGTTFFYRELG